MEGVVDGAHLRQLAREGDIEVFAKHLEALTSAGGDPDEPDAETGCTALWEAASAGRETCVRELLKYGLVSVDRPNANGVTPLHTAAADGHVGVVVALLGTGQVDVNATTGCSQQTALGLAASEDHEAVVDVLLTTDGIDPNGSRPLFSAAEVGALGSLSRLLQHPRLDVNAVDEEGRSALWMACGMGNLEVVAALLAREDVDPNLGDSAGSSPLHCAASNGQAAVVTELLRHARGLTPNTASREGQTPLGIAAAKGKVAAVRALLQFDAVECNSPNEGGGGTPLCVAAIAGQVESVREMLSSGRVDRWSRDTAGRTALQVVRDALSRDLGERMEMKVRGRWEEIEQLLSEEST